MPTAAGRTETARILDQLRRAYRGPAWHGPSVREALEGVTVSRASARPLAAAHTIWELVLHVAVWEDVVLRRIQDEKVMPTDEEDWPTPRRVTESAWAEALERLERTHERLERLVEGLDDAALDRKPAHSSSTVYTLLHGAIQHDLYHAGQIAILAK